MTSRREFLSAAGAAAISSFTANAHALEPIRRVNPRIRGLSMTAYSLKPHMKWWWGKMNDGNTLDMLGFLDYCAKLGLDGAELTSYFFEAPVTTARLNQIKRQAHILGLEITGAAMSNNFGHPPNSQVTVREMQYFRKWIDHSADLGAPVCRIFASKKTPDGATDEHVLANVIANVETSLEYAEKRGVVLGLENHDFLTNIDYLLKVLDAFSTPWLGVIWDSANLYPTPDPYRELSRIAPYAVTAQVKVMTHVNGKEVPADYEQLVRILMNANFSGHIVLEYEEEEDPYAAIPTFAADVRNAIDAVCA